MENGSLCHITHQSLDTYYFVLAKHLAPVTCQNRLNNAKLMSLITGSTLFLGKPGPFCVKSIHSTGLISFSSLNG